MKKQIIMIGIILISTTLLLVMFYIKTKNIKYISSNEIESYSNISMKLDGQEITTTSNLNSGYYRIDTQNTNCNGTGNVSWSNISHNLKVKVTNGPLKCTIALVTIREDLNIISMFVGGTTSEYEVEELTNGTNYYLDSYTCKNTNGIDITNEISVTFHNDTRKIELAPVTNKVYCNLYFKNFQTVTNFDYTGNIQIFTANAAGYYLLEVWGASGGNTLTLKENSTKVLYRGGYGGQSSGKYYLNNGSKLYIVVGGKAPDNYLTNGPISTAIPGGYNGGGIVAAANCCYGHYSSSGGGATHIALETGLLSTFSSKIDKIILVAGGGSGAFGHSSLTTSPSYIGGSGGGINGTIGTNPLTGEAAQVVSIATQTGGFAFGQGGNRDISRGTGGGGFWGGQEYVGGSGYIGNSNLSNKSMYCYNCTPSDDVSTKTYSTKNVSESAISYTPKIGNGYARVTYLGN